MSTPPRILILDSRLESGNRLLRALQCAGIDCEGLQVQTEPEYLAALALAPDLILVGPLPFPFNALEALKRLRDRQLEVPLIVLAEAENKDLAAAALKHGAAGYLRTDQLSQLTVAVAQQLERKQLHEAEARAACAEAEAVTKRLRAAQTITEGPLGYLAADDSLHELLGRTCTVLDADSAALLMPTEDGQLLTIRVAFGRLAPAHEIVRVPLEPGLLGGVALRRESLVISELSRAEGIPESVQASCHSLLAVPLLVEGGVTGVVLAGTSRHREFTDEDLRLLQLVAARAASVIEHAWLFDQVCAGRKRAQILSQQLMEAQEAERRHLARELHDEIGQALTAVKINLQAVQRATGETGPLPRLEESVAIVDRALQQVRNLSLDLRPSLLDDLGLVAALRWYLDRQAQRAGLAAEFVADPPGIRASTGLETACFRVAQEALTNVVRHAHAKQVRVEVHLRGAELQLLVQDDGTGFDVVAARRRAAGGGSLGLLGMQERVLLIRGRIEIRSTPGQGTEILVRLPMTSDPSRERRRNKRREA
jgi:signal transduction histidine kinase/DNA-binding NarL/FixJ family response regulator